MSSLDARVRLIGVRDEPLDVAEVIGALADPRAGGLGLFIGVVRDVDGGKSVAALSYTAHPTAADTLGRVAESVLDDDLLGVAALHRTGDLSIGDVAVITACSAIHRGPALAANARLIDEIKTEVPIWKNQHFSDGTQEWVGLT